MRSLAFRLDGDLEQAGHEVLEELLSWRTIRDQQRFSGRILVAMRQWLDKRGAGSKAKQRTGVPVTRKDFTALPLREMNLLWTETVTGLKNDEVPPAAYRDPLSTHDYLTNTPASKSLLPGLFAAASVRLRNPEYFLIAEQMHPDEVVSEVKSKLNSIADAFGLE